MQSKDNRSTWGAWGGVGGGIMELSIVSSPEALSKEGESQDWD